MRRFLILIFLLLAVLLVGRSASANPVMSSMADLESRLSGDISDRDRDWDDDERSRDRRRGRTHPRVRNGKGRFRLEDRDYDAVSLTGSFTDWEPVEMEFDERRGVWEVSVEVDRGSHEYIYLVEKDGRTRKRRDPANPRRTRDDDDRWVSELIVGKDGRVIARAEVDVDFFGGVSMGYQRVDGFVLGTEPEFNSNVPYAPSLDGYLRYGFASERWSARVNFKQPLLSRDDLRVTASIYDTTDFTEQTGVGDDENSITSLLVREDNRDYYRREGVALGLGWDVTRRIRLRAEVRSEDHSSLPRATRGGWWGREMLLLNPSIDEGTLRSLLMRARIGRELHHLQASWEYSHDDFLSSAFQFSQITAQYRTRLRMGRDHHLDLRLKGGANLVGDLPAQYRYVLGGIGTIRGYGYQSVLLPAADSESAKTEGPLARGGQKMLLFNAEYVLGVNHDLQVVLLFDSGQTAEDRKADLDPSLWKSSVGIGLQFEEDSIRVNLVKPLDESDRDVMIQARLNRMF